MGAPRSPTIARSLGRPLASAELALFFGVVAAGGEGEEDGGVGGEPEQAGGQRLGGCARGAPGELAVVVGRQVGGELLDELWHRLQRHEEAGGEREGQVDEVG